jgi:hypothetical protein
MAGLVVSSSQQQPLLGFTCQRDQAPLSVVPCSNEMILAPAEANLSGKGRGKESELNPA